MPWFQVILLPLIDLDFFMRAAKSESKMLQASTDLGTKKPIDYFDTSKYNLLISPTLTLVSGDALRPVHWVSMRRFPQDQSLLAPLDTLPTPTRDKITGDLHYSSSIGLEFTFYRLHSDVNHGW